MEHLVRPKILAVGKSQLLMLPREELFPERLAKVTRKGNIAYTFTIAQGRKCFSGRVYTRSYVTIACRYDDVASAGKKP